MNMILSLGNSEFNPEIRSPGSFLVSGKHEELLLIVPTNRKLRFTKKSIVRNSPDGTANQVNVETFGTLTQKLLGEVLNFSQISEGAQSVLIKQSAKKTKFDYFSRHRELPVGTLDRIKNVISEYKRHGLTPELLRREAENLGKSEKAKANDIANIYEEYEKKTDSLKAFETGDIYRKLNETGSEEFEKAFFINYPKIVQIYLEGFSEFTKLEVDLLIKLGSIKGINLNLELDYNEYNGALFGHLLDCFKNLEKRGFRKTREDNSSSDKEFRSLIGQQLFKQNVERTNAYEQKISGISAANREQEISVIASEIKRILLNGDAVPSDICVGFNVIQNYSSIIRDKFNSFGIPYNLTDRIQLDNSFSVAAVVNILEIAENDFYYKSVFRGGTNQFIDLSEVNLPRLKYICSELKIISGYDNWADKIKSAIKRIEKGYGEEYRFNLDFYKDALKEINVLYSILLPFYKKLTIPEFLAELENLITKLSIPKRILKIGGDKAEENIKGLTTFLETISEVLYLIEAGEGKGEKHSIEYYLDQIRTASKWARFNIKEKSSYGVLITSLDEIRGLNFKYLFLAGLSDGDFPTRYQPEIFFSGTFRKKEVIHIQEERYRFYQALQTWEDKLYLSYPKNDLKSELRASSFLKDFNKLFITSDLSVKDFENDIFTAENFMTNCEMNEECGLDLNKVIKRDLNEFRQAKDILSERYSVTNPYPVFNGVLNQQSVENLSDEYLLGEDYKELLSKNKERLFSISQLENYAKCPFKYFVESILKLSPYDDPTEDIEAIEFGNLVHLVLYRFHVWLRDENIDLRRVDDTAFNEIKEKLFQIAEEELKEINFNSDSSFYEIEKLFGLAGDPEKGILYKYILQEREESEFSPRYFEVTFGRQKGSLSDNELGCEDALEINGVKMQGKIDRIEISDDKQHFNIVDYKTGSKIVKKSEIEEGLALQFPVYLQAAGQLLKEKFDKEVSPMHMFIYSLKYQNKYFGKNMVRISNKKVYDYESINEELIEITGEHIRKYVNMIGEGKFNISELVNRKEKVCSYCGYAAICREIEVKPVDSEGTTDSSVSTS